MFGIFYFVRADDRSKYGHIVRQQDAIAVIDITARRRIGDELNTVVFGI